MNNKHLLACTLLLSSSLAWAGDKVDKTLTVAKNANIDIENVRGKVEISGWNKAEVSVKGELDDATEKFIFEQSDNGVLIKVKTPRNMKSSLLSNENGSNLIIHIPTSASVNFSGVSTDVKVNNVHQRTEIKTVSGDVKAKNLSKHIEIASVSGEVNTSKLNGKISLNSVSGDINDRNSSGRISLETVSGEIESSSTASEVNAQSVSGDIALKLAHVESLNLTTVSGEASAKLALADKGNVDGSSVSGEIDLHFSKTPNASFRLHTNAGGDIHNRLTNDQPIRAKYGPGEKLRFTTGNGQAHVEVSTVSGDIKVSD